MIWAIVSFWSCFCWLFRASPSLSAKNIISLISVLTIWWCPCVVFSSVVGRGCFLWPVLSFGKTLLAFALLHLYSKAKFAWYSRYLLTSCFCISVQFSSVTQSCPTQWDPMNPSTPGLPVHHQLPEFTQTHDHRIGDAIQPSHPLSSPSPPAPNPSQHQSLFQWVNSSHEVAKVLDFQL